MVLFRGFNLLVQYVENLEYRSQRVLCPKDSLFSFDIGIHLSLKANKHHYQKLEHHTHLKTQTHSVWIDFFYYINNYTT